MSRKVDTFDVSRIKGRVTFGDFTDDFWFSNATTPDGFALASALVNIWADRVEADGGTLDASRQFFITQMTY